MPWFYYGPTYKVQQDREFKRSSGGRSKQQCRKCGNIFESKKKLHEHKMEEHSI